MGVVPFPDKAETPRLLVAGVDYPRRMVERGYSFPKTRHMFEAQGRREGREKSDPWRGR